MISHGCVILEWDREEVMVKGLFCSCLVWLGTLLCKVGSAVEKAGVVNSPWDKYKIILSVIYGELHWPRDLVMHMQTHQKMCDYPIICRDSYVLLGSGDAW